MVARCPGSGVKTNNRTVIAYDLGSDHALWFGIPPDGSVYIKTMKFCNVSWPRVPLSARGRFAGAIASGALRIAFSPTLFGLHPGQLRNSRYRDYVKSRLTVGRGNPDVSYNPAHRAVRSRRELFALDSRGSEQELCSQKYRLVCAALGHVSIARSSSTRVAREAEASATTALARRGAAPDQRRCKQTSTAAGDDTQLSCRYPRAEIRRDYISSVYFQPRPTFGPRERARVSVSVFLLLSPLSPRPRSLARVSVAPASTRNIVEKFIVNRAVSRARRFPLPLFLSALVAVSNPLARPVTRDLRGAQGRGPKPSAARERVRYSAAVRSINIEMPASHKGPVASRPV